MPDLSERLLILPLATACSAVSRRVRSGMHRYDSNGSVRWRAFCLFNRRFADHQRKGTCQITIADDMTLCELSAHEVRQMQCCRQIVGKPGKRLPEHSSKRTSRRKLTNSGG